jgi:hypothetical protein
MEDFALTLEETEAIKVYNYQGEARPTLISCFVMAERNNKFSVAIEVEGTEKMVIEISDRGHKIEVIRKQETDKMGTKKYKIKENVSLNLEVKIGNSGLLFLPADGDEINGWVSYTLETEDGSLIAEQVAFEAQEVFDETGLVDWFKTEYPDDYRKAKKEGFGEIGARHKLMNVTVNPDVLYEENIVEAQKKALKAWLAKEQPTVYRDPSWGQLCESHLTFVMPGAEYKPDKDECLISREEAFEWYLYAEDPKRAYYIQETIIEPDVK